MPHSPTELNGLRFTFSLKRKKGSIDGSYKLSINDDGGEDDDDDDDDDLIAHDSIKHLQAVYWQNDLHLHIPSDVLPLDGSKEAFISMLEFAEEELKAKSVIISLDKNGPRIQGLLKLFRFLGFELLPPNHSLATVGTGDMLFLAYNIA